MPTAGDSRDRGGSAVARGWGGVGRGSSRYVHLCVWGGGMPVQVVRMRVHVCAHSSSAVVVSARPHGAVPGTCRLREVLTQGHGPAPVEGSQRPPTALQPVIALDGGDAWPSEA